MINGKCPHCGSTEIYVSQEPFKQVFPIQNEIGDHFNIHCYLCLGCRVMELHAAERSVSLFGKGKLLVDVIPDSSLWKKVP